jgi:hypothetical protein
MPVPVAIEVEPSALDLDNLVRDLERSWQATITIRRQSPADVGYREISLTLDDEPLGTLRYGDVITVDTSPGVHHLLADNTLFTRALDFTAQIGEHIEFIAVNRPHWLTYSGFAFFIGFLAGPFALTLERAATV